MDARDKIRLDTRILLLEATGCDAQHTGWTCGTCFFGISDKLTNRHWQAVLWIRGDNKREDLDNLPEDDADVYALLAEVQDIIKAKK